MVVKISTNEAYIKNIDRYVEYYKENKQRLNEMSKNYYQENKCKKKEYQKQYNQQVNTTTYKREIAKKREERQAREYERRRREFLSNSI